MGDPVCWLAQTCLSCGRFLGSERDETQRCPHCGADPPSAPEPGAETSDQLYRSNPRTGT